MERKLVQQGRNALTVTLPAEWLKKNNLTGKDYIYIEEQRGNLIISNQKEKEHKSIEIDITNMKNSLAFHIVLGKYIQGYDTIILKHDNILLAQEIGEAFLGMVIEEHNETKTTIKNIIKIPENNFEQIFKRAAQLLIQQTRTLTKIIERQATIQDLKKQERLLDKNLFYCMRYINKYEIVKESYKYFLLCSTIEEVGDIISRMSKTITIKDKEQIETITKIIEEYVTYLLTNNMHKMFHTLKQYKQNYPTKTFLDGITIFLVETLYNYIGFIIEKK